MTPARPRSPRCYFTAWVLGWATAVYLPSLLIGLLSLSPLPTVGNLFVDVFQIADEVSPAAKISYGVLFGALIMAARAGGVRGGVWLSVPVGAISIALVTALLPEHWSRGFGVGLNGVRFDPPLMAIYLIGGIASGLVFALVEAKCISRRQPPKTG